MQLWRNMRMLVSVKTQPIKIIAQMFKDRQINSILDIKML